jgi:thiol-disulfide isomerase/thioredoxin
MRLRLALRAITVLVVLCLAVLGVLLYRKAEEQRSVLVLIPEETRADAAVGKFTPVTPPRPAPEVRFMTRSGGTVSLDAYRGRVVLINLWATWCAPCIEEMPSLARLQRARPALAILAVSQDRRGAAAVDPFLARLKLTGLATFLDPEAALSQAFAVAGLPTSIVIDRDGRIVGRLVGAAHWDSPEMERLIDKYLRPPADTATSG